jgi:hypothetical protein
MWSGPRNISTAMMRSWGSRADTFVCDEPLYAHYLQQTGIDHPGREEVIDRHETDLGSVIAWLTGPVPGGKQVFYQKHMAHHLLQGMDIGWIEDLTNCFLIRDPAAMLVSLDRVLSHTPTVEETGLSQQWELYSRLVETGAHPPVLDSADVLDNPAQALQDLCARVGVVWDDAMLRWAPGPRPTDGVWAKHWYASVEASTGFGPPSRTQIDLPRRLQNVHSACREIYDALAAARTT